MTAKRFAYEEAEKILDGYAEKSNSAQFKRAYAKFKFAVFSIAYVDFDHGRRPDDVNLAHAWEDVQVAFSGYGEPSLTGCIIQLWAHTPKRERNRFEGVVHKAFRAAEEATPDSVHRRYMSRWRYKPVRRPEQGFNLPSIIPINGPRLRDWAEDNGEDSEALEDRLYWLELADREVLRAGGVEEALEAIEGNGPFLQLLPSPEQS